MGGRQGSRLSSAVDLGELCAAASDLMAHCAWIGAADAFALVVPGLTRDLVAGRRLVLGSRLSPR